MLDDATDLKIGLVNAYKMHALLETAEWKNLSDLKLSVTLRRQTGIETTKTIF